MSRLAAAYRVTERLWWGISARNIVLLIGVLMIVRVVVANYAGLLWDEPYYWMWSRNLATGYYDHPPMVAYWIWAGTHILGDSVLGIRVLFVVNTLATSIAVYGIGRALFNKRVAELGMLWTNLTPLLGIAGMMATPDGPSVLFWTLTILAYAMVIRTGRGVWWLAVGVLAGLGAVSKYTNLLLGPGIVLSLLLDPRLRRWLPSPWLWVGGALAVLVVLPVILWNAGHDWMSFRFQFGRVAERTFDPVTVFALLAIQPFIFNPFAVVFLGTGARLWLKKVPPYGREIGILLATALPTVAFILFQATHAEVLQHWLAPVFPTLALVAVAAASTPPDDRTHWLLRRIRADVVPFALTASLIVFVYATTPLDRYFPGKDPIDSIRGWPEFAAEVEAFREKSGAKWIATIGYEITAELTYELRDKAVVVPVFERSRFSFAPPPDPALIGEPAVLVMRRAEKAYPWLSPCFASIIELGVATRRGAITDLAVNRLYLVTGTSPDVFAFGCDRLPPR